MFNQKLLFRTGQKASKKHGTTGDNKKHGTTGDKKKHGTTGDNKKGLPM